MLVAFSISHCSKSQLPGRWEATRQWHSDVEIFWWMILFHSCCFFFFNIYKTALLGYICLISCYSFPLCSCFFAMLHRNIALFLPWSFYIALTFLFLSQWMTENTSSYWKFYFLSGCNMFDPIDILYLSLLTRNICDFSGVNISIMLCIKFFFWFMLAV